MVVKLQGGLGNQMFQYAYGRSWGAKFDRSGIIPPRTYALEPFNLPIEFEDNCPTAEQGYWQSEKYFDAEIASKAFCGPPMETLNRIAVHIRLTDNLTERALALHGNLLTTDYYQKALRYLPKLEIDAFSDNPFQAQIYFGNARCGVPHLDIWEMSRYKYIVIANSSFSWWAAWLGTPKVVVAPKRWFVAPEKADPTCKMEDICPDRWIKI